MMISFIGLSFSCNRGRIKVSVTDESVFECVQVTGVCSVRFGAHADALDLQRLGIRHWLDVIEVLHGMLALLDPVILRFCFPCQRTWGGHLQRLRDVSAAILPAYGYRASYAVLCFALLPMVPTRYSTMSHRNKKRGYD